MQYINAVVPQDPRQFNLFPYRVVARSWNQLQCVLAGRIETLPGRKKNKKLVCIAETQYCLCKAFHIAAYTRVLHPPHIKRDSHVQWLSLANNSGLCAFST